MWQGFRGVHVWRQGVFRISHVTSVVATVFSGSQMSPVCFPDFTSDKYLPDLTCAQNFPNFTYYTSVKPFHMWLVFLGIHLSPVFPGFHMWPVLSDITCARVCRISHVPSVSRISHVTSVFTPAMSSESRTIHVTILPVTVAELSPPVPYPSYIHTCILHSYTKHAPIVYTIHA